MSDVEFSSVAKTAIGDEISLIGVKINKLSNGGRYDTKTHKVLRKDA